MRAGGRETPIIVQAPTVTRDPVYDNEVVVWNDWPSPLWSSYKAVKGREFYDAGGLITQNSAQFEIDWLDGQGITEEMRIFCYGKTYNIKAIDYDHDLKRHIIIDAVAGLNETQL